MPDLITFQISPHPLRGTKEIGSERVVLIPAEFRAADGSSVERPILEITSTSEGEDRHGSRIFEWDTTTHMRTGQVLWQHDECPWLPQVAKKISEKKVGNRTVSTHELLINLWRHIEQAHGNLPAFLWEAAQVHEMGTISRAFIPKDWKTRKAETIPQEFAENTDYLLVEQTEESYVNVQSNRESVFARTIARTRSAGRFTDELARTLGYSTEPIIIRSKPDMTKNLSPMAKRHHVTDHHRGTRAEGPFEFASTQVNLGADIADKVLALAATIPDNVLSDNGRETTPHVTVKYGIDPAVTAESMFEVIENSDTAKEMAARGGSLTLGATAMFAGEEYDVVYVAVDSPDLVTLNGIVASEVQTTDTQPEYVPHITLAYVKPGQGQKFVGDETLKGTVVTFDTIAYSNVDGNTTDIPLAGEGTQGDGAVATRESIRAVLRCCGCGFYDEAPPVITDAARALEVPLLRQAAEISMQQVELGMTLWTTAETEQVRGLGSSLIYDGMYRFDRCTYLLEKWYGEEVEAQMPETTVENAQRALKNYRAGAVFSKKNLDKIDKIIEIATDLRSAATKPGADDLPADDSRGARMVRADVTTATARADIGSVLDQIVAAANEMDEETKASTAAALSDLLSTVEGLLADIDTVGATNEVAATSTEEVQRAARLRSARLIRTRTRLRHAAKRGDGNVPVDLQAIVDDLADALTTLADAAAALAPEVQAEIDAALTDVLAKANDLLASLEATVADPATQRNSPVIRIIGDPSSRQTADSPLIRIAADRSDVAPGQRSTPSVRQPYNWLRHT